MHKINAGNNREDVENGFDCCFQLAFLLLKEKKEAKQKRRRDRKLVFKNHHFSKIKF
jgi:hypothetical protein